MRVRLGVLVVAATVACSCSLVVSLEDLGGGEAGADAADVNAPDVGDASSAETSPDGCASYCACNPSHKLCHDFDEEGGVQGPFSGIASSGGASSALDTTKFSSPPRSARFTYTGIDAGSEGNALYYDVSGTVSDVVVEGKIFLAARPTGSTYETIDFSWGANSEIDWEIGATTESLFVICRNGCTPLGDAGPNRNYPTQQILATNQWVDFKLHVTFGSPLAVTLSYGTSIAKQLPAGEFDAPATQPIVYIGAAYQQSPGLPFALWLDDLTIDWQ